MNTNRTPTEDLYETIEVIRLLQAAQKVVSSQKVDLPTSRVQNNFLSEARKTMKDRARAIRIIFFGSAKNQNLAKKIPSAVW